LAVSRDSIKISSIVKYLPTVLYISCTLVPEVFLASIAFAEASNLATLIFGIYNQFLPLFICHHKTD
jgi:hypothetical protein